MNTISDTVAGRCWEIADHRSLTLSSIMIGHDVEAVGPRSLVTTDLFQIRSFMFNMRLRWKAYNMARQSRSDNGKLCQPLTLFSYFQHHDPRLESSRQSLRWNTSNCPLSHHHPSDRLQLDAMDRGGSPENQSHSGGRILQEVSHRHLHG